MKKWTSLAESILFAGNLFLLFLFIFGDKIAEPVWMQVLGRMHPLLLHFPIVILLMAVLWEWLPLRSEAAFQTLYQRVDKSLLLIGALSAVITAIMGMLLSLQGGYDGNAIHWHKWAGIVISFLAYFYYSYKHSRHPLPLVNKITGGLIAVCLLVAGHLGANITHGDNFLLQPLEAGKKAIPVPIDQAIVFDHLIKPVLEAKCMSCHNHRKAKGELVMETRDLFLKGGKDGKLFEPGKPELSLLIKRLHLPLEAKKHMPPDGKPQLLEEELQLLYMWIKSGAPMEEKVTALPPKDSLRILAAHFLLPASESAVEKFDFAAADDKKIRQLNTNYRVITPFARESPALSVNFYNKNEFSSKSLEELDPLKKQIVDLNLSKMPVKDADLKIIGQFENLRSLNLNFTDITGANLKALNNLKHLHHLSLSGTPVTYAGVAEICHLPELKEVFFWSTSLQEKEIALLEKNYKKIRFDAGYLDTSHTILPLPPPVLKTPSGIFRDSVLVQMKHPIQGVQIRYTLDGSEPDSINALVYKAPFSLQKNALLKAKAYKAGWYGSADVYADYYKSAFSPDSIILLTAPNEKYKARGGKTLMDKDLGDTNIGNGQLLGYRGEDMALLLAFRKSVTLHSVALNYLRHIPGYVFPPVKMEVWGGSDPDHLEVMGKMTLPLPEKDAAPQVMIVECPIKPMPVRCLKIVATPVSKLPAWHPGKGQPAWLMASEVLLN